MNDIVVFLGPTLPVKEARAHLHATYLPPAAQGDVYRAALDRPWGIAIIDGYFERVPAVWHKEILWAMHHGVHVFGAASMGALRAAELAPFGMVGVGRIFESFRAGTLTDDDEVTIAHGDSDSNYRAASVAMVDVRVTLELAEQAGVVTIETREQLVEIAKRAYYPERNYAALCAEARTLGAPTDQLEALKSWLPLGAVSQKRLDALELLACVGAARAANPSPRARVNYHFEHTDAWEQLVRRTPRERIGGEPATTDNEVERVVDELRLDSEAYENAKHGALLRALALAAADQRGVQADAALLQQTVDALRREHDLLDRTRVDEFIAEQELNLPGFGALLERDARKRAVLAVHEADFRRHLLDELRLSGAYGRLADRARDKQHRLRERGYDPEQPIDLPLSEAKLAAWHTGALHGQGMDVERMARRVGFGDRHSLLQMLARELIYRSSLGDASATDEADESFGPSHGVNGRSTSE